MMIRSTLPLIAAFGMGCTVNGPYQVGLMVKSTSQVKETTKVYREVKGSAPGESTGLIGYGETCTEAMASSGTMTVESVLEKHTNMQVVGETLVPRLIPNDTHEQEEVWLSLVMENTREAGTDYEIRNHYSPWEDPTTWTTETLTDAAQQTETSYYGVTAEEYVAKFELASMWPADDAGLSPGDAEMLTKHKPQKGDVWFSQNGNSVYMFDDFEEMSVGDEDLNTARVLVYESGDVELANSGILSDCISSGRDQLGNTVPGSSFYDDEVAMLDAGCEGGFRHVQTGTQWWYEGILVKEEVINVDVTVHDYGWEWYESTTSSCSRQTSVRRPDVVADLFIEFSVTTSEEMREAEDWFEVEDEE
jgi:hypothetical protein